MLRKIKLSQQKHQALSSMIKHLIKLMRLLTQVQQWLLLKMLMLKLKWTNQLLMKRNQKLNQINKRKNPILLIMITHRLNWRNQELLTPLIWSAQPLHISKNQRLVINLIQKIKRSKQLRTPIKKNLSICRNLLPISEKNSMPMLEKKVSL